MGKKLWACVITLALVFGTGVATASIEEKAEAVGSKTRKILGGLKKGFSKEGEKRAQLTVEISEAMQKEGIVLNSARKATFEDILFAEGVTCYMVSEKSFSGRFIARALGEKDVELAHSIVSVSFEPKIGGKVVFEYPRSLDANLVEKYTVDFISSDVTIEVAKDILEQTGLRLSQIEEPGPKHPSSLTAYAVATKSFAGRLIVTAFSGTGEELDRRQLVVQMNPEDSQNLSFAFSKKLPNAKKFTIDYLTGTGLVIEAGESLKTYKLEMTRAQDTGVASTGVRIVCYIVSNKAFHGSIIGKALDKSGTEVGRGTASVDMKSSDAAELVLLFPQHMKAQEVEKFVVEAVEEPREERPVETP